jgi:hypothetical protein
MRALIRTWRAHLSALAFTTKISDLRENDILVSDGFEYVLAISEAEEARFAGRTLDYRNGSFELNE